MNYLKKALRDFVRCKENIINVILLSILLTLIIFGISFRDSLLNFWDDLTNKSYNYRLFLVTYDFNNITEEEALKKLENFPHVVQVFNAKGLSIVGQALNFVDDKHDGYFYIFGAPEDGLPLISGENLKKYEDENVLICPKGFNPDSFASEDNDKSDRINMESYLGITTDLSLAGQQEKEQFTIVGLYDDDYSYSTGEICYSSFKTVQRLNEKYQKEAFESNTQEGIEVFYPIYFVIDDVKNLNNLQILLEKEGLFPENVTRIDSETGSQIISILTVVIIILFFITIIMIIILNLKRLDEKEKELAINTALGYTAKMNALFFLYESLIISCVSFCLALFINIFFSTIIKRILLKGALYFNFHLSINWIGCFLAFLISIFIPLIINLIMLKKISKIPIVEILKE